MYLARPTGNIALNKCVIKLDPCVMANSPWCKLDIECPIATVIPKSVNCWITSRARCFSGAKVIIDTFSNDP